MAYRAERLSVTDQPTALLAGEDVVVQNTGSTVLDLGGADVTFGHGFRFVPGQCIGVGRDDEPLFACAASGSSGEVALLLGRMV